MERKRLYALAVALGLASGCRGPALADTGDASASTTAPETDADGPEPFDPASPDLGPATCDERALPAACIEACTYEVLGEVGEVCGVPPLEGRFAFLPPLLECTCRSEDLLAVEDVDGDGVDDLVARCSFDELTLWYGGTGRPLDCPQRLSVVSENWGAFTVVDVDSDGRRDLVLVGEETISVLRSLGERRYAGQYVIEKDRGYAELMTTARVDGDEVGDLVVVAEDSSRAWVYFGDGAGGFTPGPVWQRDPSSSCAVAQIVDLDADARVELLLRCNDGVEVVPLAEDGFGAAQPLLAFVGDGFYDVRAAELDGDGWVDLLIGLDGDLLLARGAGPGGFAALETALSQAEVQDFILADLDGDGALDVVGDDVVEIEPRLGALRLFAGDGAGGFTPAGRLDAPGYIYDLGAGDLNGDGRDDAFFTVLVEDPVWNGIVVLESAP